MILNIAFGIKYKLFCSFLQTFLDEVHSSILYESLDIYIFYSVKFYDSAFINSIVEVLNIWFFIISYIY